MGPDRDAMVQELWDRAHVGDVPRRYSRGIDRRDWDVVRSCFTAEATVAGSRTTEPVDQYLQHLYAGVEYYPTTMHFLGNQLIELDGDRAFVDTYAVAYHWKGEPAGSDDPRNLIVGVRYQDDLIRTDGGWLINNRKVQPDWRIGPYPDI